MRDADGSGFVEESSTNMPQRKESMPTAANSYLQNSLQNSTIDYSDNKESYLGRYKVQSKVEGTYHLAAF